MVFIDMLSNHILGIGHSDSLQIFLRDFNHFTVRVLLPRIKTEDDMEDSLVLFGSQDPLMFKIFGHQFIIVAPYSLRFYHLGPALILAAAFATATARSGGGACFT